MDIYEKILNDPEFLDLLWREQDATTKYQTLEKAGFKLEEEYKQFKNDENRD